MEKLHTAIDKEHSDKIAGAATKLNDMTSDDPLSRIPFDEVAAAAADDAATTVANSEFDRWADFYEIKTKSADYTQEENDDVKSFRAKFVRRIKNGTLTVDSNAVLTLISKETPNPIIFPEPKGNIMTSRLKNDTDARASLRMLEAWTGTNVTVFPKLSFSDLVFCTEMLHFFTST